MSRNRRELASPEMFRQMQKKGVAETVSNVKVLKYYQRIMILNILIRIRSTQPVRNWSKNTKQFKM